MKILIHSCCLLVVLLGHDAFGFSSVSPSSEVQKNFQQLMETNSCPGCDLSGALLNRVDLSGADLEGANLAGAKLYLADLTGTNMKNANLQGAALGGADLADADLRGANLTGAILEGAYFVGARMDGSVITRKSNLEDDVPATEEVVYVADDTSSKKLPFTNTVFVASSPDSGKTDVAEQVKEKKPDPVTAESSRPQPDEAEEEISKSPSLQEAQAQMHETIPKASKKLVMFAEAVVPESVAENEGRDEVVDMLAVMDVEKEIDATREEKRSVDVPGPEQSSVVEEKVEDTQPTAGGKIVQQDPSGQISTVQVMQVKPPVLSDSKPAEPASGLDVPGVVVADEKEELPPEPESAEPASDPGISEIVVKQVEVHQEEAPAREIVASNMVREAEQVVILDEDTVVAEMAPVKEVAAEPAAVAAAQNVFTERPVQEENDSVKEKFESVPQDNDSTVSVQEEILQVESVAPAAPAAAVVVSEPPGQDMEKVQEERVPGLDDGEKERLMEKLLDDNSCVECDLSGVDLSGRHLDEADLERANLRGANLSDADLSEANLKGADLSNANLREADLREADLYRANLSGADLTGARFEEAMLDMVYSTGAIGADFKGALTD